MVQRLNAAFHLIACGHTLVDAALALTISIYTSTTEVWHSNSMIKKNTVWCRPAPHQTLPAIDA